MFAIFVTSVSLHVMLVAIYRILSFMTSWGIRAHYRGACQAFGETIDDEKRSVIMWFTNPALIFFQVIIFAIILVSTIHL